MPIAATATEQINSRYITGPPLAKSVTTSKKISPIESFATRIAQKNFFYNVTAVRHFLAYIQESVQRKIFSSRCYDFVRSLNLVYRIYFLPAMKDSSNEARHCAWCGYLFVAEKFSLRQTPCAPRISHHAKYTARPSSLTA